MGQSLKVYFQHCSNYDNEELKKFFDRCCAQSSQPSFRSAKILLKPNLLTSKKIGPATTDPRFIVALGEWLIDMGARVSIGDSPAFGKARAVLHALGIDDLLVKKDIRIVEFSEADEKRLNCGVSVSVASQLFEYDYFFNIPKVKAHGQLYVTLSVKNLFGLIQGLKKSMLHMRYGGSEEMFAAIIVDLIDLLPPHYTYIDGIEVMHKGGPVHGEALDFHLLGFSGDPVAADTAMLAALQLDCEKSPLWCEARKRGCSGSRLEKIEFPLLGPERFHGVAFQAPEEISPIRFDPLRYLWGNVKRVYFQFTG